MNINETMPIMEKPFFIEGHNTIYAPVQDAVIVSPTERYGSCVHTCPKFMAYPTTHDGVRMIPRDAKCPYAEYTVTQPFCSGAFICKNGNKIESVSALADKVLEKVFIDNKLIHANFAEICR